MPSRRCDWPDVPLICGKDFEVEVDCAGGYPVQADGESIGRAPFRVVTTDRQILVLSNVLSS